VLSPLTAVSIALSFAERAGGDERLLQHLERGRSGLKRVKRVVDGLLGFARAGAAGEPGARAELREVVDGVLTDARPAADEAHVDLEAGPLVRAPLAVSPGLLTSAIGNLVSNAIKHLGASATRRVAVRAVERGAFVRVEVEDTGPGLAPGFAEHAFEPYVRGSHDRPGLGLGLATVKKIVEGHGGCVGVDSAPGRGCRFWFELPKLGIN
jgi:signal transduction histidine kinase